MLAGFPWYKGLNGRNELSSLKTITVIGGGAFWTIAGKSRPNPARNSSRFLPTRRMEDSLALPTRRKSLERTLSHLSAAFVVLEKLTRKARSRREIGNERNRRSIGDGIVPGGWRRRKRKRVPIPQRSRCDSGDSQRNGSRCEHAEAVHHA